MWQPLHLPLSRRCWPQQRVSHTYTSRFAAVAVLLFTYGAQKREIEVPRSLSLVLLVRPCVDGESPQFSDIPDHATEEPRGWRVLGTTQTGEGARRLLAQTFKIRPCIDDGGTHIRCWVLRTLCVCHTTPRRQQQQEETGQQQWQVQNAPERYEKCENTNKKTKTYETKYENEVRKKQNLDTMA